VSGDELVTVTVTRDALGDALGALAVLRDAAVYIGQSDSTFAASHEQITAALAAVVAPTTRLPFATAAAAPDGRPLWLHTCGAHHAKEERPTGCGWCYGSGEWRRLHTLAVEFDR
jgi:hypothetical protein